MKPEFTIEYALHIQAQHLRNWELKLNAACYNALRDYVLRLNKEVMLKADPRDIPRGSTLDEFVANWKPELWRIKFAHREEVDIFAGTKFEAKLHAMPVLRKMAESIISMTANNGEIRFATTTNGDGDLMLLNTDAEDRILTSATISKVNVLTA